MSTSVSSAKADMQGFQQEHGALETWSAVDMEVHQNLALAVRFARRERWRRPLRRTWLVLLVAYVFPFYVVAEVIHAVRGTVWMPLDSHLDTIDSRIATVEDASLAAGDTDFTERFGAATDRLTEGVGHTVAYLVRG